MDYLARFQSDRGRRGSSHGYRNARTIGQLNGLGGGGMAVASQRVFDCALGSDLLWPAVWLSKLYSRSHVAVIRVYDGTGNVRKRTSTRASSKSGSRLSVAPSISLPKCRAVRHNSRRAVS